MSEKHSHVETQKQHEDLYRRTVRDTLQNVEEGRFTEDSVPTILHGLHVELAQCLDLQLISPEFYSERIAEIQSAVAVVMDM